MLTDQQVAHYRTFGFVVLRNLLDAAEVNALRNEVTAAHRDAFGASHAARGNGSGIEGHYLPLMADHTPRSASLPVDDPRLLDRAMELLDAQVVPTPAEGILYFAEAGWHYDDGIGVTGLKIALYLEPLAAETGALRLLPLSHHAAARRRLERYRLAHALPRSAAEFPAHIAAFPYYAAETCPGDAVVFDLHTWHASAGGRDRLCWSIEYLRVPRSEEERAKLRKYFADVHDQTGRGFDHHRYPAWRDWIENDTRNPRRAQVIEQLRELGILALPNAAQGA